MGQRDRTRPAGRGRSRRHQPLARNRRHGTLDETTRRGSSRRHDIRSQRVNPRPPARQNIHVALDARSEDYARFIPLFGGRDQFGFVTLRDDLEDEVESLGSHVVILDRVQLAPAWRGLGGVGRLLTARLLRWVCADPRLVAVLPFPIDLDRALLEDDSAFEPALEKVRRTWAALGFQPAIEQLWIMDPAIGTHHNAVTQIEQSLGLSNELGKEAHHPPGM
ncbi:hypothetical protein [Amycolatopsis sp. lyj-112]|uniref:hypothetical protein n=1 Tax=Amycolatopsis sp. lyj-112 TaxID=2789288 RepID=UPI00397DB5BC